MTLDDNLTTSIKKAYYMKSKQHLSVWTATPMKLFSLIIAVTLLAGAASLRAQATIASLQSEFSGAYNDLQQAAVDFQQAVTSNGDQAATINDLDAAISALAEITNNITSTNIQAALGKKYLSVEKAVTARVVLTIKNINKVLSEVQALSGLVEQAEPASGTVSGITYSQRKTVIRGIQTANAGVLTGGLLLGKPLVANKNPSSAGFYQPGAWVEFQIDTSGCPNATVTVVNATSLSSPIDTSTVSFDPQTGILRFQMGTDAGGGDVQVSGCETPGLFQSVEVYNYGKTPVAGVPSDFPQNLPTGEYVMTYSASGEVSIPPTTIGAYKLTNLKAFYDEITYAFNLAISQTAVSGCSQSVSYSPYSDNSFSVSYSVTCTSGQYSATESMVFTLTRQ